jgi:hypothetical protein
MAKEKTIYAPGELDKVKGRLGNISEKDAKRMQQILGGEVGREGTVHEPKKTKSVSDDELLGNAPKHRVDILETESNVKKTSPTRHVVPAKALGYIERVKMDTCCAEFDYNIKTPLQLLISKLSFFSVPKDKVSPYFIKDTLEEYYKQIEILVSATRLLFPRNNTDRNSKVKKASPFAANVLNIIRQWKLNVISSEIGKLQSHPRYVFVSELSTILCEIYKPMILLERLATDPHIQTAFDQTYKIVYLDNPSDETQKLLPKITEALVSFGYIRKRILEGLYPLLMKFLSSVYMPYAEFMKDCRVLILNFVGISESEILHPPAAPADAAIINTLQMTEPLDEKDGAKGGASAGAPALEDVVTEDINEIDTPDDAEKDAAKKRAVHKGIETLIRLFPTSGLESLDSGVDIFPYFSGLLDIKKGSEIVSPQDPAQLALVLSHIISELLLGFREIKFTFNIDEDDYITPKIEEWQKVIDETFYVNYIPRISEYAHILEQGRERLKSQYAMNLLNDIHWVRRYYILPYYEYKSGIGPSFRRKEIYAICTASHELRVILTELAEDIDNAVKKGSPTSGNFCEKMKNAFEPYKFQIDNVLTKRMGSLLPKNQCTNVSLIFFTLACCSVLDDLLNNPGSAAYNADKTIIFRSLDNKGIEPVFWVEKRTDMQATFNASLDAASKKKGKS